MNCTVDYSVFGRVADHCGQQEVFGYLLLAVLIAAVFIVAAIVSQRAVKRDDEDDFHAEEHDRILAYKEIEPYGRDEDWLFKKISGTDIFHDA